MQAKPLHLIPTNFPSPIDLPPVCRTKYRPALVPRAITISTPNNAGVAEPPSIDVIDDSVAAFWDYQFLFVSQRSETAQPAALRVVDGAIPADFPAGTYYLAGPGLFADDHGSTVHPLDGHGYLRAFTFDKGNKEVKFMAKYVKTAAQVEEHDPLTGTWRFTHRGPFSLLKGGQRVGNTKVMKNVANTSVLRWGGRLMCLWEGGDPYEIESGTLDTVGMFDVINGSDSKSEKGGDGVDGVDVWLWDMAARMLKPVLQGVFKMPPKRLLSHYKIDARRNRLIIMACNTEDMLLPRSNFTFYEFDSSFKLLEKQEFSIPDHLMIHDWAFTDTHYLLFGNRVKLDVTGAMAAVCGISPMISALSVNPSKETTPVYLLPRFPGKACGNRDWRVPVEIPSQLWLLHVGNAFQVQEDGGSLNIQVYACACSYHWFNFHKLFGYNWESGKLDPSSMNITTAESEQLPHLVQLSITLDAAGNSQRCSVQRLIKASDFPAINPAFSGYKNKYIYAATSSGSRRSLPSFPFDMVMKLDVRNNTARTWSTRTRRFLGEPIFVPKGDEEDDGYLLVVEYAVSMQRCFLVILNPKRIGEGDAVVARLEVPKHLNFPLGFHGFWASQF